MKGEVLKINILLVLLRSLWASFVVVKFSFPELLCFLSLLAIIE